MFWFLITFCLIVVIFVIFVIVVVIIDDVVVVVNDVGVPREVSYLDLDGELGLTVLETAETGAWVLSNQGSDLKCLWGIYKAGPK